MLVVSHQDQCAENVCISYPPPPCITVHPPPPPLPHRTHTQSLFEIV